MVEDLLVTTAVSRTTGVPGRSLSSARTNHFVVDEPAYAGGPGEAATPAEIFLAGVSACGVLLVEAFAREEGLPLKSATARIEGIRTKSDPANFREVRLRLVLEGVDATAAARLVERYKAR
ncbi:MAG TPA: OsmC family protein [Planctomycetota bacterium]|nr:OsmC family protein [Planctomycetota bacterium]